MSDIPKSKRAHSNLEAQHLAISIRQKISLELLASFGYSQKKLEEAIKKQTKGIQDPEHRKEISEAIRKLEDDYACWTLAPSTMPQSRTPSSPGWAVTTKLCHMIKFTT